VELAPVLGLFNKPG